MKSILLGNARRWEAARIPFNLVLILFAAVALEPLSLLPGHFDFWSYASDARLLLALGLANIAYFSIYPLDGPLQASTLQRRESAGRFAVWAGLTLLCAAVIGRVADGMVVAAIF